MWTTIEAERGALVDDLTGVSTDAWDTPSLCDDWRVEDVLAHIDRVFCRGAGEVHRPPASTTSPPGPKLSWLGDAHDYPTDAVRSVLG